MTRAGWAIGGVGLGAGLMYWADPRSGRVRRAHVREKALHLLHGVRSAFEVVRRDMSHRARGLLYRGRVKLHPEDVDDVTLEARVRSAMGRVCSHPGAIQVACRHGQVELKGPILASESKRVLACVRRVRGVREIDDDLEVHEHAGHHPDLQGDATRPGSRPELLQRSWSPTARFLVGLGSVGLLGYGLSRGGKAAPVLGGVSLLLGLRSLTNLELKRLTGVGAGPEALTFHKDITLRAPVNEVFAFWQAMHNFPRFMSHVEEVEVTGEGHSRWKVRGPAGIVFEWDAVITRLDPGRVLAWKSVEGSMVENAGIIHFEDLGEGRTRLDIRLSYNPPAGLIGHAFAKLLGADPKKQMDDDLLRLKSLMELGKATGHETVSRDELVPGRGVETWVY
ncbi:SRPBCC family protein [Hyalangium rubrum]|uniref:SRPBCC family protein n=1 Tax=Hyalangium rubrum TaxID=3103134 RepID=A0ABU5HGG7_9BACT|nr:SRPBCC family protein [Hyalangium sp. s54d21]MDY7232549.1 SRPBCC family protein [Hyalangium sp. s54d21]